jgi:hypothetical protein
MSKQFLVSAPTVEVAETERSVAVLESTELTQRAQIYWALGVSLVYYRLRGQVAR